MWYGQKNRLLDQWERIGSLDTNTDFAENTGFQQRYKGNSVEKEVFELSGAATFAHAHAKKNFHLHLKS